MKKISTLLSIAAAILVAGCAKELPNFEEQTNAGYRTVTFNCAPGTKVTLNSDSKQISWHGTEYMGVYSFTAEASADATGTKFTATGGSAEFTGEIVENAVKAYAIYPFYCSTYSDDGGSAAVAAATETVTKCTPSGTITTSLAQTQYLVKGGVNSCSNLSACVAEIDGEGNLSGTLKNVCAYLKLTLANASTLPIRQILVESVDNAPLSGLATISFTEGIPAVEGLESTYVVGLANHNASPFEDGTYYMTMFPANLTAGLHITLSGTDGKVYEFTTPAFNAERNKVYNLGTIDAGRTATSGVTTVMLNASDTDCPTQNGFTPDFSTYSTFTDNGYTFGTYMVRKNSGAFWFFCQKENKTMRHGFIESPALTGKILKKVNVVFMPSPNSSINNKTSMRIKGPATGKAQLDGTNNYTGLYQATSTTVASNKTLPILLSDNSAARYFHQFVLGEKGDREGSSLSTEHTPTAGTAYQLIVDSSYTYQCLVRFIEFVYEDAE